MKIKSEKIEELINELDEIISAVKAEEDSSRAALDAVCPTYQKSARNLVHYAAFRTFDLRRLQKKMRHLGLSRFARAEGHVMASLLNSRYILGKLIDRETESPKSGLSIKNATKQLTSNTKALLGYRSKGRRVRIMVTQPTEAATNYQMVHEMVRNGMNCARINCAHDSPEVWEQIIRNIKKASHALGRRVTITMDLAGPKIRTGAIQPGPKIRKFSPERDDAGNVINPALIVMTPMVNEDSEPNTIAVSREWLSTLEIGDKIKLTDTRSKERTLKVIMAEEDQAWVNCYDTSYIGTGTVLRPENPESGTIMVGELPPIEQSLILKMDDLLYIHRPGTLGVPAQYDEEGKLLRTASISCQLEEVFNAVRPDEPILFDDGKIEGVIEETEQDHFKVRITRAKENGSRLKAEKGINFPSTDLSVSGLTDKDRTDLEFVCAHADVVNFSFVNTKEDVEELLAELEKLGATNQLSVILKIETRKAFDNLKDILLTAMQVHYVGVMIARGDLAVETGWHNIGWVQSEILSLCNAAHIPVVWATQVLENLAKKGLPSRSEITDAASSLKAECVMLNKGNYINDAIKLLDHLLRDLENFQEKNESMLPQLEKLLS